MMRPASRRCHLRVFDPDEGRLESRQFVAAAVQVPTIDIGAGPACDGQVLVLYDLLGLNDRFKPKFLQHYAELAADVRSAVGRFADDVRGGRYPDADHSF